MNGKTLMVAGGIVVPLFVMLAWPVVAQQAPHTAPQAPAAAPAPPMPLQALDQLEPGLWRIEAPGQAPKIFCLTDPAALTQVVHEGPACRRFVIANEARSATVHYSCASAGWGRTTVRVDNPQQVQIQTQGIAGRSPFDFKAEARRTGPCGAVSAAQR